MRMPEHLWFASYQAKPHLCQSDLNAQIKAIALTTTECEDKQPEQ